MEQKEIKTNKFSPCQVCFNYTGHDYNPERCNGTCDYADIVHERDVLKTTIEMLRDDLKKVLNCLNM